MVFMFIGPVFVFNGAGLKAVASLDASLTTGAGRSTGSGTVSTAPCSGGGPVGLSLASSMLIRFHYILCLL